MNNEKKLYRLIESNMEAVAYVTYLTGMVIDEKLFNALPNRLRKSFTDIMTPEIINRINMENQEVTLEVTEAVETPTEAPVEETQETVEATA